MNMPKAVIHLHQFTFHVDTTNGEVTQLLAKPKGASHVLHKSHPMIPKVYAAYARDKGIGGTVFNGHPYVKLWGRVVNLNNGNQVQDRSILSMFEE